MVNKLLVYKCLCILRISLVFIPQIGYIHPDEHFQGPEIAYGDIAEYNILRTWEFSSSEPIRSIIVPYSFVVPALIIRLLTWLQYEVNSYLLLILPRILICIFSFLLDISIYQICIIMKANYEPCLILFASSYVTLIYFTRTFSNSLEGILFGFFLFLLFKSLKVYKKTADSENSTLSQLTFCYFMCGITLILGCFVRPTFICFSVFPMIVWSVIFYKVNIFTKINIFLSFILGAFSMGISLIVIDSLYYNKINYFSVENFKIICTPINFLFYNLNSMNLSSHGLHPRWLHVLINIPLLFSFYGILLLLYFIVKSRSILYKLCMSFETLLLLCFFIPLFLLSVIPHQEPRFIIPLIIPLSLFYSGQQLRNYLSNKFYIYIWISSNLFCLLFYGFVHQAGVYLSIDYLNNQIKNNDVVIFYKTYMPPRHLFFLNEKSKNIGVYDFAGLDLDEFESRIQDIIDNNNPLKVFVVLPYKTLSSDITFETLTTSGFKFIKKVHFWPHLSTENLPNFLNLLHILQRNSSLYSILYDIQELFSIHIILFEKYFS